MLRRSALVALCVWLALVQGCRHQSESSLNLTLAHEVSPHPPRVGQVTITLTLTDTSATRVTGARMALEGNMTHPGMVPVFADARETEPGRYQSSMELSMAGDWHVLVHVSLTDGRKFDRQFEIKEVKQ
ncbi:MAG TPA: FixH family protein [Pyrinomonadaceae bacterium]|nr:FixH family protein [Pyrinomonadaceae bacterium]